MTRYTEFTVRTASADDAATLVRLAALDCAPVPALPALVAEQDGVAIAALPLAGGRAVADPFVRTADALALLELRAAQLASSPRRLRRPALRAALLARAA